MKRILALTLVSVMMITSSVAVFATDTTNLEGSKSPAQERIEELEKEVKEKQAEIEAKEAEIKEQQAELAAKQEELAKQQAEIKKQQDEISKKSSEVTKLENKIEKITASDGSSSSRSTTPTSYGNSVSYSGSTTYQAGKVEINGGKSNVTFTIKTPSNTVIKSAQSLAKDLGGSLLNCINTSTPGVAFTQAKINFVVSSVKASDTIAVYQYQNGKWVQLTVTEVRDGHVVVNLTQHGDIAFVKVPYTTVVVG